MRVLAITKNGTFTNEEVSKLEKLLGGTAMINDSSPNQLIFSDSAALELYGTSGVQELISLNFKFENFKIEMVNI